jgi:N-acetylmuramoyl-L-alanine amidase
VPADRARLLTTARILTVALAFPLGIAGRPAAAQAPAPPARITVQPGDTLSDIAVRYYGTAGAAAGIAAANRLADPDRISHGTEITLPPVVVRDSTTAAPGRRITIDEGDTLGAIAARIYGSEAYVPALAAANGITAPDLIRAGTELVLPPTLPSTTAPSPATARSAGPLAGRHICLDPGHGGDESGAAFSFEGGRTLREADVALDMSLLLAQRLRSQGAVVTLTRQTDTNVGLAERAARCNASGAELAVSVHLNGVKERSVNGALALYAKPVERSLADVMARLMQSGLFGAVGGNAIAFGARPFPGHVLLSTTMPAVIVEPSFLTNPTEARALVAPASEPGSRRAQIVREIERGVLTYLT